jgi:hypothetical protein
VNFPDGEVRNGMILCSEFGGIAARICCFVTLSIVPTGTLVVVSGVALSGGERRKQRARKEKRAKGFIVFWFVGYW